MWSVINNHLSVMFLVHVSTSIRSPSLRGVFTKAYKYGKFCQRHACVELKYNIVN